MQLLDQLLQTYRELSPAVFALLSIASTLTALAFIGHENRFAVQKNHGVTRVAGGLLRNALVMMACTSIGLSAIAALKGEVTDYVSVGIPAVISAATALMILLQLLGRPTFTWRRFWIAIGMPLSVPLLPAGNSLIQVLQNV
jgi:hypothetical protein